MKKYSLLLILALVGAVALFASVSHSDDAAGIYGKTKVLISTGGGTTWVDTSGVSVEENGGLCWGDVVVSDEGGWYWICEVRDTGYYHLVATITLGNTTYKGEASGYDSLTINAVYRDIKLYPTHGTPTGGGDE